MKKKYYIITILSVCLIVIIYFIPIPTNKMCGESPICWYKFGVYNYEYNAESGGNTILGGNIFIHRKLGGFWEYLGFKKVNCEIVEDI